MQEHKATQHGHQSITYLDFFFSIHIPYINKQEQITAQLKYVFISISINTRQFSSSKKTYNIIKTAILTAMQPSIGLNNYRHANHYQGLARLASYNLKGLELIV